MFYNVIIVTIINFRSQNKGAREYFQKVAAYTRELDPTRPITVVTDQVDIDCVLCFSLSVSLSQNKPNSWQNIQCIIKIQKLYIILLCTHLFHFFPVSFHSLQCIHCLLQLYVTRHLIGINQGLIEWQLGL